MERKVKAKVTKQSIPSYRIGKPEVNPVFFEKRVYQGSSGKVYPVPFIDKVYEEKVNLDYQSAVLENDFVKLVMLPEIGGRIFEAQDKANNNYNFFYQQKVIKPALVGLAGPWISGGVEFNWPQHHRPGTYLPSDVSIEHEADGTKTVWMSEYDPINHLKGMHGIRVRPDSSLIELRGRIFNPTPFTHSFLWWANVAVEVHDEYESFFPPDVDYVADHAVRAMSSFPFAENDYYGIPYHLREDMNDLRKYQNIPVPTSYMVCDTKYDFFGGYDHKAKGGFVHVANRHIAPGKKQWTWGCEEFGRAWDRELTDEGGPYFELMAGVYTDNQPDFTYLFPYETKTFSQFWWSYKKLGPVQNANNDLALRLEVTENNKLEYGLASSRAFEGLKVILFVGSEKKIFEGLKVSPEQVWLNEPLKIAAENVNDLAMIVLDHNGKELIAYRHKKSSGEKSRKVAFEPKQPKEVESVHELELIGEHLELYRHPTRYPEPYWQEALDRDPYCYKALIALGRQEIKKGRFQKAEEILRKAIEVITTYHPNPASGEAHYFCGLACSLQRNKEDAYSLFYKSTWNYEWRSAAYYQLALIDCLKKDYTTALEHIEASLNTNRQNNKALILKALIKRSMGKLSEAEDILQKLKEKDPLDQWANYEEAVLKGEYAEFLVSSRNDAQTIINIAFDYVGAGFYAEAIKLLELHHTNPIPECVVPNPMGRSVITFFTLAWLYEVSGEKEKGDEILSSRNFSFDYLFPSRINEQIVLEWALNKKKIAMHAAYGLGNYYYDLKRHEDAIRVWEEAAEQGCEYSTLYRNLGIALWNVSADGDKARSYFLKAIELYPTDMRIQYEYDQLRKKLNDAPEERLRSIEMLGEKVLQRDDFAVELAALYNYTGQYDIALELLQNRNFHPWEGGEGQVLKQFTYACLKLGQQALERGEAKLALDYFQKSFDVPDNLGEKYHPLQAIAHINYWKGKAFKAIGNETEARKHFQKSAAEEGDFIDMAVSSFSDLTFYSAMSMKELGDEKQAGQLLSEMKNFVIEKEKEEVKIDYFATSLPLLLVFNEDLEKRNLWESKNLLALAEFGLGNSEKAKILLNEVLELSSMHVGAKDFLKKISEN